MTGLDLTTRKMFGRFHTVSFDFVRGEKSAWLAAEAELVKLLEQVKSELEKCK